MARGGYRAGAGRPRGSKKKSWLPTDVKKAARKAGLTPLEYMLMIVNDEDIEEHRRDRMAIAAAPFCHPRMADNRFGKTDAKAEAAKEAAVGKFAPPPAPKLIVDNS